MTLEHYQEEIEDAENDYSHHDSPDHNLLASPDTNSVEENTNAGFHNGG